jgi:GNAT superfamily N-acetyltransferase
VNGLAAAAIRPARTADAPALGDFFAGLSMQARYLRFFAPTTPNPDLLNLLSGGSGNADAVLATRDAVIIGHAMAADRSGPGGTWTTEIGVVVADDWQGQGVGSALVRAALTRAQARGVTSVTMDVLHGNHRALVMIADHWPAACTRRTRDYEIVCVQLPHGQQDDPRVRSARPGAAVSPHGNSRSRVKIKAHTPVEFESILEEAAAAGFRGFRMTAPQVRA